jgi:hypothetical protein
MKEALKKYAAYIAPCVTFVLGLALGGCATDPLKDVDYGCVDLNVEVEGYFTDSNADGRGRGVKVPEGETLSPELARILCPPVE